MGFLQRLTALVKTESLGGYVLLNSVRWRE